MTSITQDNEFLLGKVTAYVKNFMSNYDPSHDWNHIRRVVNLARQIQAKTPNTDLFIVTLSALLHDVGDRKYAKPDEDPTRQVHDVLISFGVDPTFAQKIQTICLGVSYSSEVKDPSKVIALIKEHPELAVVQDADRLDAIGAVGVGRCFAFGGARNRGLDDSIEHFDEKLIKLEGMMKTEAGREMAKARSERVKLMVEWWADETAGLEDDDL